MAWAALLVLACLVEPSPEVVAPAAPGASEAQPAAERTAEETGSASSQAPSGSSEGDPAPPRPSAAELVDPWASVPVQTAVPTGPGPKQPFARAIEPRPHISAPLLDPFAGAARRHVPRQLDLDLRDPFRDMQPHREGLRLARADLRDPFARRPGPAAAEPFPRPSGSPAAAERPAQSSPSAGGVAPPRPAVTATEPEAGMPLHPDLRDPFGRRKHRPAPPAPEAAPAPPPPATPPSSVAPLPPSPRSGALLPSSRPFAHLPRARRPA